MLPAQALSLIRLCCPSRHSSQSLGSSRSSNARIVKQHDLMIRCEAVRDRWIPAIHIGVEVCQKEERNCPCFAETTVGITSALSLNKLCWNRFVCVIAYSLSPHHSFRYQHCSFKQLIAAPLPTSDPATIVPGSYFNPRGRLF